MSTPAAQPQQPQQPEPEPYVPDEQDEEYIQACGETIIRGLSTANDAASGGDADKYLKLAQGVRALADVLVDLKHGPGTSRRGHE